VPVQLVNHARFGRFAAALRLFKLRRLRVLVGDRLAGSAFGASVVVVTGAGRSTNFGASVAFGVSTDLGACLACSTAADSSFDDALDCSGLQDGWCRKQDSNL
jgi:hypothetical protein